MAELVSQFEEALQNIEPSDDDKQNASVAHQEVRDALSEDPVLKEWGIETILIGSYKRHVSIRRVKDVDVLSKLSDLPEDTEPAEVLDAVNEALLATYPTDRVEPQDRSFKVLFPDFDLYVDAVPARLAAPYLEIPDRRGDDADESDRGWVLTNPEELTRLSTELNERFGGEICSYFLKTRRLSVCAVGCLGDDATEERFRRNDLFVKEATAIGVGVLVGLPVCPVAPFFTATMWYCAYNYYRKHKRAHLDTEWARRHLPWHYDHHMGPNPDANWCVTRPWFDEILGTREPYVGTERERQDRIRRKERAAARARA